MFNILKIILLEFCFEIPEENVWKFLMKKKSSQNDAFNPFKSALEAEHANITGRASNTAPMEYCLSLIQKSDLYLKIEDFV